MGGNVFAGKTSKIAREHITPTLSRYFEELSSIFPNKSDIFNERAFCTLGSVRKKDFSNDIDLGIDAAVLLGDNEIQEWGLEVSDVNNTFDTLKRRARTATDSDLRMKAFLKCLAEHINANAPILHCDEKKVTNGNLFGLYKQFDSDYADLGKGVQIDWMVGNIEWLKFSYYSAEYIPASNVKGLHRTQLLLSAFQVANLSFNHVNGVKDKETGIIVATEPSSALATLSDRLGFEIDESVAQHYYNLHNLLKQSLKKSDYQKLLAIYLKILDSTRADIPDDLQQYWIANKERLGLTGKFLPDNSTLKEHV